MCGWHSIRSCLQYVGFAHIFNDSSNKIFGYRLRSEPSSANILEDQRFIEGISLDL